MVTYLIWAILALVFMAGAAQAQYPGTFRSGSVYGNPAATEQAPTDATISQMLDRAIGSTPGTIPQRGASTWGPSSASGGVLGPGSTTIGDLAGWGNTTGSVLTDIPSAGVLGVGGVNSQTANYTVATTDCSKTISFTGNSSLVTLPASGFTAGCRIAVCNDNANAVTQHGMRLSGFPSTRVRLYPQQCTVVSFRGGGWKTDYDPGLFRPQFVPAIYVDNAGNDNNDGLVGSGTGFATVNQCFTVLQTEYFIFNSFGGAFPACYLTGGQIFTSAGDLDWSFSAHGIQVLGNGASAATIRVRPGGNVALTVGDNAIVQMSGITIDCTGGASGSPGQGTGGCTDIYMHQYSIIDTGVGVTLNGHSTNDYAVVCDAHCNMNFDSCCQANGSLVFSGQFYRAIDINHSSNVKFSQNLTIAAGTAVTGDLFWVADNSRLEFQGTLLGNAGTTIPRVVTSIGNSVVCLAWGNVVMAVAPGTKFFAANGGQIINVTAIPIPGTGAGFVGPLNGFSNGFAPDGAGGNTGVNATKYLTLGQFPC